LTVKPINPSKRKYLLEKRKEKNLSTKATAQILGISPTHYNDIENGKRNPSIELSLRISDFFKLPLTRILKERTQFVTIK
jgi:transcriptional regulator with XRE-family HTH domain